MVLRPRLCSFRCCFCESALPSSAEAPTWGGGGECQHSCAWLPRAVWGGWRPQHPALPGACWLGSQPCGARAAAHQPAPWHPARDASQPGKEAAWLSASSRCLSCQPGGRPGRPETPRPPNGALARPPGQRRAAHCHSSRGPYGCRPQTGLRDIISPGGDPGRLVPINSAQLSL